MSTKKQLLDCVLNGGDILEITRLGNIYKRKHKTKINDKILRTCGFEYKNCSWIYEWFDSDFVWQIIYDKHWTHSVVVERGNVVYSERKFDNVVKTVAELEDVFDMFDIDKEIEL